VSVRRRRRFGADPRRTPLKRRDGNERAVESALAAVFFIDA
jgi:hypothetical protein